MTATQPNGAPSDPNDQVSPRNAERVLQPSAEQRQWRFVSAVHAARALNARPA